MNFLSDIKINNKEVGYKSDIAINKSTLGYVKKNLLKNTAKTSTKSGVTFTINDDKSITVNGTATAQISFIINNKVGLGIGNYILTGCPSGGSWNTFYLTAYASSAWLSAPDFGSGCRIENKTVTQVVISIASGYTANNLKFYPMLRDADITNSTYEPYKESVDERLINNTCDIVLNKSTLGYQCKNLLKNNAVTQTVNGVTFTVNTDGSVTVNGTNTSSSTGANLEICGFKNYGDIKLTASLKSTDSNVYMSVFDKNWVGVGIICDNETTWYNDNKERYVRLVVKPGATVENVTVYPMIRYADITDSTYEPYQPSLIDRCMLKDNTGTILYKGGAAASTASITIENLSKYSLVCAYIDGASTKSFRVSCSLPISYLSKGNTVYIGGIPSSNSSDSSTDEYVKSMNGYIKASMTTDSPDVLNLEVSDGIIGGIQIISVM